MLNGLLSAGPLRLRVPWSRTHVLFGDERCVPPDHEQSNYRMVKQTLLEQVRIPEEQVYRIEGERDPEDAAAAYEARLRELFRGESVPRFDLLLLGMGNDGHTASLFPQTKALDETERWVVANDVPQLQTRRITLTYPAIRAARRIVFMITGDAKAKTVAEAFGGVAHEGVYPCERAVPLDGDREILLDRGAASLLP